MQLSRLHLSGFKSFADETTLEFGAGITAVVGPNGSGKSNIVDALLWCLGERSNKALRGQNATDVIFSGTQTRRATGRAEVNLFFNNESGVLPIGFKEVQVSRTLLRDGQGEYGLCGSKCRLRDVLDLFLDTGVGPDAGCIISQGEIDAILSAKPEDRRGLVEGAAGIQKYHARRSEARRRMEKVEADVTRVSDILAELESQLLPLEAQAALAQQYEALAARLRQLQLSVLWRDFQTRTARLGELRERQAVGAENVGHGRREIAELERLEVASGQKLRELEREVESLASDLTRLVGEQKGAEGALAVARERGRALGELREFAAREVAAMRTRLETSRVGADKARAELDEATRESATLWQSAALAEGKLGAATQQLSLSARDLGALQAQVLETLRASQAKRESAAADRARAENGRTRLGELEHLLASGIGELETAQAVESGAQAGIETCHAVLQTSQIEAENQRIAWQAAQAAAKNASDELAKLREARSSSASRSRALRELEQNLEGFQGGTRAILESMKRGELPSDYLPVADAIRAQARYESAIETALGGNVNNLICPDESSAKRGVEFLRSRRAGRATFLPLSILEASFLGEKTQRVLGEKGVLGLASELVDCKAGHDVAVGYLLNRFLVVETLDDALRLAKRCESGARLVSLEGELVLPAGAITGGAGKQKAGGLLARKRELDEAAALFHTLDEEIKRQTGVCDTKAKEVGTSLEAWRAAQNEESDNRSRLARAEREWEAQARESRRLKSQIEAIENQRRALEEQLNARALGDARLEQDARTLEERARELDARVSAAQLVVAEKTTAREAVRDEVSGVRAAFARTQERLNAMRRGLAELERGARELESQIAAKDTQIERARAEGDELGSGEGELLQRLETSGARRAELERRLHEARTARGAALEVLDRCAGELKTSREKLHTQEDELHRVEVRLASTEAEMHDIERRLRDEFSLALEEPDARNQSPEESPDKAEPLAQLILASGTLSLASDAERRAALEEIAQLSAQIGDLGQINIGAVAQYASVKERLDFLSGQRSDLETARGELDAIIFEIDGRMREQFVETFRAIEEAFEEIFQKVMGGGTTRLALTQPKNLLETGIDLRVQLPGKAAQDIGLLSGGERALTALSFMMAILKVRPSPFVVLDEVDAPLDQSNVGRFIDLLREFTPTTQFIVITHNNGTMQAADVLYGVTQQEAGVSTLMSVRLAEGKEMAQV